MAEARRRALALAAWIAAVVWTTVIRIAASLPVSTRSAALPLRPARRYARAAARA